MHRIGTKLAPFRIEGCNGEAWLGSFHAPFLALLCANENHISLLALELFWEERWTGIHIVSLLHAISFDRFVTQAELISIHSVYIKKQRSGSSR